MQKFPLFLLFFGHVWVDASQGILPVALVKLKDAFGLTYFQVGAVTAVLNFTSSVIQPLFGFVADRYRLGWFVPWGIVWTALSMGLIGLAPSYALILLLVGFAGLGTAAFHPRAMMAVSLVSGNRRGFGTAVFVTGGNLGFALGPVVGSFLVLGFGLHATLGLVGPGLIIALAILLYPADYLKRENTSRRDAAGSPEDEKVSIPWIPLILVCLIVTLRSWVYISFITYLPMFLQGQGVEIGKASLMLTLFLAGGAAAGLYGGHLSDRIGRVKVIVVSMLLYPLFMSMAILSREPWLWILIGASGAALLASYSVTIVLAQELLPRNLGLASGLILGLGFGAGGLGVALSGLIADAMGLYRAVWILALVPVVGSILAAFIRSSGTKPTAPGEK